MTKFCLSRTKFPKMTERVGVDEEEAARKSCQDCFHSDVCHKTWEKAAEDDEQENGFVRGDLDNKEIHLMKY